MRKSTVSDDERPEYTLNFRYLLQCVGITKPFQAKPGTNLVDIPNLDITVDLCRKVYYGKRDNLVLDKNLENIARAFSLALVDQKSVISLDNLKESPKEFSKKFPADKFIKIDSKTPIINMNLFTNQVFRCYYACRNSPNRLFMGYFKLCEVEGKYSAYLVRGISSFCYDEETGKTNDNGILKAIKDAPEKLRAKIKEINAKEDDGKEAESIHLYYATNRNIKITRNVIKIDFCSVEKNPLYSTLFWYIDTATRMGLKTYIGGSSMLVDTNTGTRGREIAAFKLGLEKIENLSDSQKKLMENNPLALDSSRVLKEIQIRSEHGRLIINDFDDDRWYRFLLGSDEFRENTYKKITDCNIDDLLESLASLESEYQQIRDDYSKQLEKYQKALKKQKKKYKAELKKQEEKQEEIISMLRTLIASDKSYSPSLLEPHDDRDR